MRAIHRTALGALLPLLIATPLFAAPPASRRPEVFGYAGYGRAGGDEGSLGSGPAFGGGVTVPLTTRLAFDFEVLAVKTARDWGPATEFRQTRTALSPSLLFRWPAGRSYFFAGGGASAVLDRSTTTEGNFREGLVPPGWTEIRPGVYRGRFSDTGAALNARAGVVIPIREPLLVRLEFYSLHRYVLPDFGVKVGLGYRF